MRRCLTGGMKTVWLRAPSHGLHARYVRFAAAVAGVHATLASGWWPTLAGRDSNPMGSNVRFPLGHHLLAH